MKTNDQKFTDYIGRHAGEKIVVVGLSPKSIYNFVGTNARTIGVNDIARYYPTDYSVCIDPPVVFTDERIDYIEHSKSRALFSQLDWSHPRLCKISLNNERGSFLSTPQRLDISYTSTFVACNIAYWMGASKIGITGQDHDEPTHSLAYRVPDILKHLKELKDNLGKHGVKLVSLSPRSRINDVLPYEDASTF